MLPKFRVTGSVAVKGKWRPRSTRQSSQVVDDGGSPGILQSKGVVAALLVAIFSLLAYTSVACNSGSCTSVIPRWHRSEAAAEPLPQPPPHATAPSSSPALLVVGIPATPGAPPKLLSDPWLQSGCDISALTASPFSVTWHANPPYFMAGYGPDDYVTQRSPQGSDNFFEQGASNFFVSSLQRFRKARAANDAREVWFLDVGANIGVHSLAVAAAGFPVISVEGFAGTAARLNCSKTLNKWDHWVVVHNAIAPAAVPLCFAVRDEANQGMNWLDGSVAWTHTAEQYAEIIAACPPLLRAQGRNITDILARRQPAHLPPPTVVKVDIEGNEMAFLRGMVPLLEGTAAHLLRGGEAAAAAPGLLLPAWPEASDPADRHKWRPEMFVMELRHDLLATNCLCTPRDVMEFMHNYSYRVFYADLALGELTHVIDRVKYDEAQAHLEIHKQACPNYVFLRGDLNPEDFKEANKDGCAGRRR